MRVILRGSVTRMLVPSLFLTSQIARASDDDPLPPPALRVEPTVRPSGEADRSQPSPMLDHVVTGHVGAGAVLLLDTREYALYRLDMDLMAWWRNVGVGGSFSAAHNGSSSFVTVDLGFRGLGSSSKSGPFVGGGFGFRYIALEDKQAGNIHGEKTGAGAYLEAGVIVSGIFIAGLRGDVPFFAVGGTTPSYVQPPVTTQIVPIALSTQMGVLF